MKIKKHIICLLSLLLIAFSTECYAIDPPAVGVLGITGNDQQLADHCTEFLTGGLSKISSIYVVERHKLAQMFSEQELVSNGFVANLSNKTMQSVGLDYIMLGTINVKSEWTQSSGKRWTVSADLRLINSSENTGVTVWSGHDVSTSIETPIEAADEAIYDCMRQFYEFMPTTGKVFKVVQDKYYITVGSNYGVHKGDTFTIQEQADAYYDEDTNRVISIDNVKGEVKVIEVHPDYCIAQPEDDNFIAKFSFGDVTAVRKICGKPRSWIGSWSNKVKF